jgi:hypothetical protein
MNEKAKLSWLAAGVMLGCGLTYWGLSSRSVSSESDSNGLGGAGLDPGRYPTDRPGEQMVAPIAQNESSRGSTDTATSTESSETPVGPKKVDPRLGRHLWSDAELGINLSGPWEAIEMNDYMYSWDPASAALSLTKEQITARRGRLLELWYSDEAYWASRSNVLALLGGIQVLRDPNSTTSQIRGRAGMALMIAKYWVLYQAGLTRDLESGEGVPEDIQGQGFDSTGTIGVGNIYAAYGYNDKDFPLFAEWSQYEQAVVTAEVELSRRKSTSSDAEDAHSANFNAVDVSLPHSLRSQLLDAFEIAVVLQQSVTHLPSK